MLRDGGSITLVDHAIAVYVRGTTGATLNFLGKDHGIKDINSAVMIDIFTGEGGFSAFRVQVHQGEAQQENAAGGQSGPSGERRPMEVMLLRPRLRQVLPGTRENGLIDRRRDKDMLIMNLFQRGHQPGRRLRLAFGVLCWFASVHINSVVK